jgi:hypothetical protein
MQLVFRDPAGAYVIGKKDTWPRIFAVDHPVEETGPEAVLDRIAALAAKSGGPYAVVGADFQAKSWAALCAGGACAAEKELRAAIDRADYGTNWLSFRTKVDKPAVLVVSDLLAPGWFATVDGRPQLIFQANYLFRGLLLGPGTHTVRMEYRPPEWKWAFLLAAVGWTMAAGALIVERRYGKPTANHPTPD